MAQEYEIVVRKVDWGSEIVAPSFRLHLAPLDNAQDDHVVYLGTSATLENARNIANRIRKRTGWSITGCDISSVDSM